MFQKLWRVASIQRHFDPWHPNLVNKCEAQLDAILEAYAEDHPRELRVTGRGSAQRERDEIESVSAQWADKLTGRAKESLRKKVSFKVPTAYRRPTAPRAPGKRAAPGSSEG